MTTEMCVLCLCVVRVCVCVTVCRGASSQPGEFAKVEILKLDLFTHSLPRKNIAMMAIQFLAMDSRALTNDYQTDV